MYTWRCARPTYKWLGDDSIVKWGWCHTWIALCFLGQEYPVLNGLLPEHTMRGVDEKAIQVKDIPRNVSTMELGRWQREDSSLKYKWEAAV